MADIARLNLELARLDAELRAQRIEQADFRAQRRRLLLDFDERATTTTPGVVHGDDPTAVDPPFALARISSPAPEAIAARSEANPRGLVAATGVLALVAVGLGAGWYLQRVPAPPAEAITAPSTIDLPQNASAALMQSLWTDADLTDFLQRWSRLSPDSIRAAADDPRIWLLRGETEQRLRDAHAAAASVDASDATRKQIQQLEQVQTAIRAP